MRRQGEQQIVFFRGNPVDLALAEGGGHSRGEWPVPLKKSLGFMTSISLVVGCMIGTGVFMKPAVMATHAGSIAMVLTAWVVAGLLSYAGALTYAELCSRMPAAGGEYALIKSSYGNFPAYLYGWMRFTIGAPGSAASYAVGAATFLHVVIPYENLGIRIWQMAVFFILIFTFINCLTIFISASVQVSLTLIKVLSIAGITITLYFFTPPVPPAAQAATAHWPGMASFSAALMAALWAYDGWNNLPMMGGEVKNAERNLPWALALGIIIVIVIYVAVNVAFFRVLSFTEILAANPAVNSSAEPVATLALAKSIPGASVRIIAAILVISALGAMNGSIFASARVPYAMARDGLFFPSLAKLSGKNSIPVIATVAQGGIAVLLAISGSFDQLTDSVVFASWLFYGLTAAAIFKVRGFQNNPQSTSHFKMPLYPGLPLVFLLCAGAFLVYAVIAMPQLTVMGLAVIALGIPVYYWLKK